ncbi:hypothetical protein, partial [Jiangella ureilytica]|uniref:hypothetical protein n=1 Tax=Jiangella ureilytica TaxID=2530374 RepID=UPI00193E34F8
SCDVSFRENHWRGLADHHTMASTRVVTHAVRPDELHHKRGHHRLLAAPKTVGDSEDGRRQ